MSDTRSKPELSYEEACSKLHWWLERRTGSWEFTEEYIEALRVVLNQATPAEGANDDEPHGAQEPKRVPPCYRCWLPLSQCICEVPDSIG